MLNKNKALWINIFEMALASYHNFDFEHIKTEISLLLDQFKGIIEQVEKTS